MNRSQPETFTQAVIKDTLANWEDIADVAREWAAGYADRTEAEVAYAVQLASDFKEWYCHCDCGLTADFFKLAFERTNWRRVARSLLDRFARRRSAGHLASPSLN